MVEGLISVWDSLKHCSGLTVVGWVMIYVLGVLSGTALQLVSQSDDDFSFICMDDTQHGFVPWHLSPFKAWQKRDVALDELSDNPWVLATDRPLATEAYFKRTEHIPVIAGFLGTTICAIMSRMITKKVAG